jgi:hypothetical protein
MRFMGNLVIFKPFPRLSSVTPKTPFINGGVEIRVGVSPAYKQVRFKPAYRLT